ncbi:MAG: PEP-CTERM sorting domain-containing protein [Tistlia sp.]|uniref:PEP-CTERM sorting domain-containing protein n=1 Tax=Tistlia sp. TaxID=3057121 RepID=UPI0034A44D6D
MKRVIRLTAALAVLLPFGGEAEAAYWNLFNFEEETAQPAVYATYATLPDMLTDSNRTGTFVPAGGAAAENLVGSGSDGTSYWSLFNFEGEAAQPAVYVTYTALTDMLGDSNRAGAFAPAGGAAAENLVGSGSDGTTYWSLFNFEEEAAQPAVYVTYATLLDMLTDDNRTGTFAPAGGAAAENLVGSGSDGTSYWSLFNFEGETLQPAVYVTYATLSDMLGDSNRTGSFVPSVTGASAANVVGSGASILPPATPVAEPATLAMLGAGLGGLALGLRRRRAGGAAAVTR